MQSSAGEAGSLVAKEEQLMDVQTTSTPDTLAGKYMSFQLGDEVFGLGILDVREIIGLMDIKRVPRAPEFIRGIINLRGRIIPVVDLRVQFGMEACTASDQAVIIVVQCEVAGRLLDMGLLVDRVLEVLQFKADQIEPPPDLGAVAVRSDFILGVGKVGKHVVFLLHIAQVLSSGDATAVVVAAA
jgi:purine-binding chemotaxis protein CheW